MNWYKDFFASLWLAIKFNKLLSGLIIAIPVIALILLLPVIPATEQRIETYYETEMKKEIYPVSESYQSEELVIKTSKIADGNYTVVPFGIIFPFKVEQESTRITGRFINSIPGKFAINTLGDRPVWEYKAAEGDIDVSLPAGDYTAIFREDVMWGEDCYIYLVMQWSQYETVTRYRTVETIKEVPVMVEKQKTVTETFSIPRWEYLFKGR